MQCIDRVHSVRATVVRAQVIKAKRKAGKAAAQCAKEAKIREAIFVGCV